MAFYKNVFKLSGATVLGQLFTLLSMPFITRMFSPEQLGDAAFFISVSMVLAVVFTARLEQTFFVIKLVKNVKLTAYAGVILSFVMAMSSLLILLIIRYSSFKVEGCIEWDWYYWLFPFSAFLIAVFKLGTGFSNRQSEYGTMSFVNLSFSVCHSGLRILFGIMSCYKFGLILAILMARIASILFYTKLLTPTFVIFKSKIFRLKLIAAIKQRKKSIQLLLPTDLINVVAIQSPFLLIPVVFGADELGYFSLVYSVAGAPLVLVGTAVSNVFRTEMSEQYRLNGRCDKQVRKLLFKLITYLAPIFFFAALVAEPTFIFVFGDAWSTAGEVAGIVMAMFFFQFLARVFSYIFVLVGALKENLLVQVTLTISTLLAFGASYFYKVSFSDCMALYSFIYCVVYCYTIVRAYIFSQGNAKQ